MRYLALLLSICCIAESALVPELARPAVRRPPSAFSNTALAESPGVSFTPVEGLEDALEIRREVAAARSWLPATRFPHYARRAAPWLEPLVGVVLGIGASIPVLLALDRLASPLALLGAIVAGPVMTALVTTLVAGYGHVVIAGRLVPSRAQARTMRHLLGAAWPIGLALSAHIVGFTVWMSLLPTPLSFAKFRNVISRNARANNVFLAHHMREPHWSHDVLDFFDQVQNERADLALVDADAWAAHHLHGRWFPGLWTLRSDVEEALVFFEHTKTIIPPQGIISGLWRLLDRLNLEIDRRLPWRAESDEGNQYTAGPRDVMLMLALAKRWHEEEPTGRSWHVRLRLWNEQLPKSHTRDWFMNLRAVLPAIGAPADFPQVHGKLDQALHHFLEQADIGYREIPIRERTRHVAWRAAEPIAFLRDHPLEPAPLQETIRQINNRTFMTRVYSVRWFQFVPTVQKHAGHLMYLYSAVELGNRRSESHVLRTGNLVWPMSMHGPVLARYAELEFYILQHLSEEFGRRALDLNAPVGEPLTTGQRAELARQIVRRELEQGGLYRLAAIRQRIDEALEAEARGGPATNFRALKTALNRAIFYERFKALMEALPARRPARRPAAADSRGA